MKILVTGGAGYVGSQTCKYLSGQGHQVLVFDNLSSGFQRLAKWGDFVLGDLTEAGQIIDCLRDFGPDGVLHFASRSLVGESMQVPDLYLRDNYLGLLNLVGAMAELGLQNLVMSGTCAVYAGADSGPLTENSPLAPSNPYAWSKLLMEQVLRAFEQTHGLNWVSLRYFNAAGADPDLECGELHDPETHLIPRVLLAAQGKLEQVQIFGTDYPTPDGTCLRDYVHVQDLAVAHLQALDYLRAGAQQRVFNLGAGQPCSVLEIVDLAKQICGRAIPVKISARRPGDQPCLYADNSLARQVLNWRPKHSDPRQVIITAWNWLCSL